MELPTTTCSICTQEYVVAANICRRTNGQANLNEYLFKLVSMFSPTVVDGHNETTKSEICIICERELSRLHKFLTLMERSYGFLKQTHDVRKMCKTEPPEHSDEYTDEEKDSGKVELIEVRPDIFNETANFEQVIIKEEIDDEMVSEECDVLNPPTKKATKHGTKKPDDGEKPHKCEHCPKRFTHRWQLKRHRKTHASVKPFRCEICSKDFLQQSVLKKHYMVHTGESRYQCDHCAKGFLELSDLKRHRLTHTGEKPFKCDICLKGFSQTSILKRHRVTHTGEKQFKCDVCAELFSWQTQLKRHMRVHGDEQHSEKSENK